MSETERVEISGRVGRSAQDLFSLLSDYRRVHLVIEGLEPLAPLPGRDGSPDRFSAHMLIGGRRVRLELALREALEPTVVTWQGIGGESRSISFHLSEVSADETDVTVTARYERPSGLSGLLTAPVVAEAIRHRGTKTLALLARSEGQ